MLYRSVYIIVLALLLLGVAVARADDMIVAVDGAMKPLEDVVAEKFHQLEKQYKVAYNKGDVDAQMRIQSDQYEWTLALQIQRKRFEKLYISQFRTGDIYREHHMDAHEPYRIAMTEAKRINEIVAKGEYTQEDYLEIRNRIERVLLAQQLARPNYEEIKIAMDEANAKAFLTKNMTWGMINAALLFAVTPVGVASWGVQIWRAARTLKDSDKLAYRGKARLQLEASARAKTIDVFSEWLKVKIPGGQSRELRKRMAEALLDTTLCNMKVVKPEY